MATTSGALIVWFVPSICKSLIDLVLIHHPLGAELAAFREGLGVKQRGCHGEQDADVTDPNLGPVDAGWLGSPGLLSWGLRAIS